jgi:hypothetical protein
MPDHTGFLGHDANLRRFLAVYPVVEVAAARVAKTVAWRNCGRYLGGCRGCRELPGLHPWRQVGFDRFGRPAIFLSLAQVTTSQEGRTCSCVSSVLGWSWWVLLAAAMLWPCFADRLRSSGQHRYSVCPNADAAGKVRSGVRKNYSPFETLLHVVDLIENGLRSSAGSDTSTDQKPTDPSTEPPLGFTWILDLEVGDLDKG